MSIKKTIVATGVGTAVLLGGGAAALAAGGSSSTPAATSSSTHSAAKSTTKSATTKHKGKGKDARGLLRHSDSVTWVTGGKNKPAVTHDAIRGQVVSVSSTSIRVESPGKTFETYAVNAKTKVHVKADGKGKAGTISEVKKGDRITVTGTGTGTLTARAIHGAGVKTAKTSTTAPATR